MDSTSWTLIRGAAGGHRESREEFARRYTPVVRAYLCARWREAGRSDLVEDAQQEVLMECFRAGGVLERAESRFDGGFRAYLFGVVRNVARNFEKKQRRDAPTRIPSSLLRDAVEDPHDSPSRAFERAWARSVMRDAAEYQKQRAEFLGAAAKHRVELLRLRFEKGVPIREIAARWNEDPARVHHEYARARREFRGAVEQVVRSHGGTEEHMHRELENLMKVLGTE